MKIKTFIPPVVALAVVGAWVGTQRQSIASIEEQSVVLRKHIATVRASGGSDPAVAGKSSATKPPNDKQPLDWKKIAGEMEEMQRDGGMRDMRSMMRLQARLQNMTSADMLAALDEIAALDLSAESRAMLEQIILGPLVLKDPELALTRFIDRLGDEQSGMSYQLAEALKEWAKKDPAKAGAWFDQQIAAGKFDSKSLDGKSQSRSQFEGTMISLLLSSDPDAANRRVAALPEDQRADVLRGYGLHSLKEEAQPAFADLVRKQLPEKDQPNAISSIASQLVSGGGYDKVTAYLDRINATPAERKESVEDAAESKIRNKSYQSTVTSEDIDSMREWVTAQSPESLDRATGKALRDAMRNDKGMKFSEASELAQKYSDASGNDQVIVNFLEHGGSLSSNKDEARVLAEKVIDPKRREKILSRLE